MNFSQFLVSLLVFTVLTSCGITRKAPVLQSFEQEISTFRESKKQDFRENPHAPLVGKELEMMRFFEPDQNFQVTATLDYFPQHSTITVNTSAEEEREYIEFATLNFELDSKPMTLVVHTSKSFNSVPKYKDLLFLMFTDETTGEQTYGGGRYIDLSKKDIVDGKIVVDFNKAYHPYCHYSSGFNCPIPPQDNHLGISITAGEKNYAGSYKGEH